MLPADNWQSKKNHDIPSGTFCCTLNTILKYAGDFLSLFFPELCYCCGKSLVNEETAVCTECLYDLPFTNFHLHEDNPVARQLWGRFPFIYAGACFYFHQHSKVQTLIHQLKYNNKQAAGIWIGNVYGRQLKDLALAYQTDLIIPVPLHKSRERKRGFNQSECIAKGISEILNIPVNTDSLKRNIPTVSQTHKSRFSRYENMKEVFSVIQPDKLKNKHILIIDDVITTGATLESCATALMVVPGVKISIAAAAFTV